MSSPAEFARIALPLDVQPAAEQTMAEIAGADWRETRGSASWAGLAAEVALCAAYQPIGDAISSMRTTHTRSHDIELTRRDALPIRIEVKTRAVDSGWTDPARFEWLTVPTHDGREPIKDVDLVFFCWYSAEDPAALWVLGFLRGPAEFKRRAQFYREGAPLPRGGWAPKGGAWCIEVKQLRPVPRGMFKEIE